MRLNISSESTGVMPLTENLILFVSKVKKYQKIILCFDNYDWRLRHKTLQNFMSHKWTLYKVPPLEHLRKKLLQKKS